MKKLPILLLLLIIQTASAQRARFENNIVLLPHMFPLNELSGYGYTSLTGPSSNLNTLNPAALNSFSRLSGGITYQFQTDLEEAWIFGIGSKQINSPDPQSVGLVYPLGDFHIAAGMNQLYRGILDIGPIFITSIDWSEEFKLKYETKIDQYSLSGSYVIKNGFDPGNNLSLGLRVNFNNIHEHRGMNLIQIDEQFSAFSFALGAIYNISSEDRDIIIGLSFESGFDERTSYQFPQSGLVIPPGDDTDQLIRVSQEFIFRCEVPAELNTGFLLDMKNKFIISGNFNYIFWRSVQDNSGNEPQISGSFIYNASDLFTGSIGLLYSSKLYDNFVEIGNKISALYFTIGAQINFL